MKRRRLWSAGIILAISVIIQGSVLVYAAAYGSVWVDDGGSAKRYDLAIQNTDVHEPNRQCQSQLIQRYDTSSGLAQPKNACVVRTNWGNIAEDGSIALGRSNTYYSVALPTGQTVLQTPQSASRLYVRVYQDDQHYRVGYYESLQKHVRYDEQHGKYVLSPGTQLTFLVYPGTSESVVFRAIGFSNNSNWAVGIVDRLVLSIDLVSLHMVQVAQMESIHDNAFFTPAISNDGLYVALAGEDFWKLVMYDQFFCGVNHALSWNRLENCTPKVFTDNELGGSFPSNVLFRDDGRAITYNAVDQQDQAKVLKNILWTGSWQAGYGFDYIALGDSYSSGEGADPFQTYLEGTNGNAEFPQEKCHIGSWAYPYKLASAMGMDYRLDSGQHMFQSVACAGAHIKDVNSSHDVYGGHFDQVKGAAKDWKENFFQEALYTFTPGRTPQINFLSSYQPRMVTLTIGGNDVGFANFLEACLPAGATCERAVNPDQKYAAAQAIKNQYQELTKLFRRMQGIAPQTRVYVVGYPIAFATNASHPQCALNVMLDIKEREFMIESTKYLNTVIKNAAHNSGVFYVDVENVFAENGLCNGKGGATVKGVTLGDDRNAIIGNETYHPNSWGHQIEADNISHTYGDMRLYRDIQCPVVIMAGSCIKPDAHEPVIPSYFHGEGHTMSFQKFAEKAFQAIIDKQRFRIMDFLKQNSPLQLTLYSTPRSLGTFLVSDDGSVEGEYTLPDDIESGYHTLVARGVRPDGQPVEYRQTIYINNPAKPLSGQCKVVQDSGYDQDKDGVDDACDGEITANNQIFMQDSVLPVEKDPPTITQNNVSIPALTPAFRSFVSLSGMRRAASPASIIEAPTLDTNISSGANTPLPTIETNPPTVTDSKQIISQHKDIASVWWLAGAGIVCGVAVVVARIIRRS